MICPGCNRKISNDSKYCPRCGKVFDRGDVKKYSDIFETDLLEVYYPPKDKKVKIWGVSLRYAFFTYLYAIYEKMYFCATISIINLLYWWYAVPRFIYYTFMSRGFLFYSFFYTLELGAFVYLFYIFRFDKLLEEKRKLRINKIVSENREKTKKELIEIIEKQKYNKKGFIIALIISIILIPILIYYFKVYLDMYYFAL